MSDPSPESAPLGVHEPIREGDEHLRIEAWRDTDDLSGPPIYHLAFIPEGQDELSLFAMSPDRIKALIDGLQALHSKISGDLKR